MEGIFTPLHVGEEVVDPSIVEDQTNCGGGGSDAENRGEDDDAPMPSPAPSPTALPFDLQLTPSNNPPAIVILSDCHYSDKLISVIISELATLARLLLVVTHLEDDHAGEHEGERDERE